MHTSKVKKTSLLIYTVRKSYQLLYISFLVLQNNKIRDMTCIDLSHSCLISNLIEIFQPK